MSDELTCVQCQQPLYARTAKTTAEGYAHPRCPTYVCKVDDCTEPHHAYGYCNMHARRWRRYGDPLHGIVVVDTQARLEDLRWMADTGEGLTNASERIGEKVKTVEAFLRRHDRDCLARLIAHEPKDHNRRRAEISISELTGLSAAIKRRKKVAA